MADMADASVRLEVLEKLLPTHASTLVSAKRWGARARASLDGDAIRYAYLDHSNGLTALRLYPADTLAQARIFYNDHARVDGARSLAAEGWDVVPNLHFGFINRGYAWSQSAIGLDAYLSYWESRIDELREWKRSEWEAELTQLIDAGIMTTDDVHRFSKAFTDTKRQTASPRPGILVSHIWGEDLKKTLIADQLPELLSTALSKLKEPLPVFR